MNTKIIYFDSFKLIIVIIYNKKYKHVRQILFIQVEILLYLLFTVNYSKFLNKIRFKQCRNKYNNFKFNVHLIEAF